jgi:hypothetical protein
MTWNGGNCTIKETLLALNYAESAIYDQIWFCELNDIGSEEIQAHFFFEALSCLLSDATQVIFKRLFHDFQLFYSENNERF